MVVIAKRHPTMTHNTPDATQPTLVIGITQTALQTAGLSSSGSTSQTATAPSAQNSRGGFGNEPSPGSEPGSSGQPEQGGQAPGQVGNPSGLSAGEPNANATANAQTQTPSGASDPQSGSSGEPGQTPSEPGQTPGQTPGQSGEPSEPGQQAGEPGQTPSPSGASEPQQALPDASDLEAIIGPRGQTKVTSANRNPVRKWLVRKGVAYQAEGACKGAGQLSVSELNAAYNDTTDQTLRDLLAQQGGQTSPQTNGANSPQTPSGQPEPQQAQTPQTPKAQTPKAQTQTPSGLPEPLKPAPKVPSSIRKHALHDETVALLGPGGFGVFVFGPAGSGKTTLGQTVAQTLGLECYISGAVQKDFKVLGYKDARGEYQSTPFRQAFEHGGLFLFDEIDASNPQVLLVLNAALANGVCDFPDRTVKAHPNFRFIASANTNGGGATAQYSGRNKLDAATLDRFAVLECDYDDALTESVVKSYGLPSDLIAEALEWVATVRDYRLAARQNSIDLVLSPRAAFFGVRVLATRSKQFKTCKDLLDCFVLKKVSDPEARKRLAKLGEAAVTARRTAAQPTA